MSNDRFISARRDGSALAITIGVHAGVAAIALLAVTVSAPKPSPPIIITNHPDPVTPKPIDQPPPITERSVSAMVDMPVIIIDNPPPKPWEASPMDEPPIIGPTLAKDPPPVPPGSTSAARFDPRHAAARQPPYPATARRLAEEGAVVVTVLIGRDGRVLAATLAQSSGSPRLDAAAVDHALKHWRFTPALTDGIPIEATRTITVHFNLTDG